MNRRIFIPILWLMVFVLAVGLACSVSISDDDPTATAPKEKPTKRPTATQSVEATTPPEPTQPEPTEPPAVVPTEAGADGTQPGMEGNPNASQSGEVFFQTEFDDIEGWKLLTVPKVDSSKYRAFLDNGQLYLEVSPKEVALYAFYDLVLNQSDAQVDTWVQKVAGPNTNNLAVICRASDAGWYEFNMTSGGYWYIYLYDGQYHELGRGATTAIRMRNEANQLTAACVGSDLTFYINSIKVGSVTDRTLRGGGQVGVAIWGAYPDLGVVFEWFSAIVP